MQKLNKYLKDFNLELTKEQLNQFQMYYEMLIEWNEKMNLTSITDFDEVLKKHFADSLALVQAEKTDLIKNACRDKKEISLIDIGTDAGFPSIPLKIAFPNLNITMLDSLNKRIKFLNEVICSLGLKQIEAVHGRAEDFAKPGQLREKYDVCVSRAVANLSTLSEYCIPYVKKNGIFVSYKSEIFKEERVAAERAISILGGKIEDVYEYTLPHTDFYRCLCVIRKMKSTPGKYPRKAGLPSKEPIQ